jgi:NAD(P)H-hydrate epimerase
MREIDRDAIALGLDLARMMENAGAHLAHLALRLLGGDLTARRITVLAGPGGNGGGGLVAARRLIGWGADVEVRLATDPADLAPIPRQQLDLLVAMKAAVIVGAERISRPELFLDSILGYSQKGSPRSTAAQLVAATEGAPVLSLDVPSGLDLELGTANEPAVRATATITLALPKSALCLPPARRLVGELFLADISIPAMVYERLGIEYRSPFAHGPIVRLT